MIMEKKICLSIEQMQRLKELGAQTKGASMCWVRDPEGKYTPSLHDEYCYEMSFMNPIPAFTLQDMLERIPGRLGKKGEYFFSLHKIDDGILLEYSHPKCNSTLHTSYGSSLGAAFDMLIWLIKKGYLKGGKL